MPIMRLAAPLMSKERLVQLLAGFLPGTKQQGVHPDMRSQESGKAKCGKGSSSGGSNSP
jgi:hypothetical protein